MEDEISGEAQIRANLQGTQLAKTDFTGATLTECKVYGMSAWDLKLNGATQHELKIRYRAKGGREAELLIDDLEIAQYLYMLLNNKNLQTVINATTSRVVLILGRFSEKRKKVLEAIKDELRKRKYVPIIFDFKPSPKRDLTETIQFIANLAMFVIADLTDAKSLPLELSHIVPNWAAAGLVDTHLH